MVWNLTLFTAIVSIGAILAIAVGVGSVRKRPDPMAWPIAIMMIGAAMWAIPHAISFGFSDVEQVALWHKIRYPGTVIAPVAYLIVALKYGGYNRYLSRRFYWLLSVIPVLTVIVVWTNQYHGLFWQSLSLGRVGGASVLEPQYGAWYWVNLGFLYAVTIGGLLALIQVAIRAGPIYRKQALLMFLGGVVPLATNGLVNFGTGNEPMVDFTTTALAISGGVFALALFHFDLLEVRPVARARLIEELDDGVIVVGPDGRIRDFNPIAGQILGGIAVDQSIDQYISDEIVPDGGEMVVEVDGRQRWYRTRSTELTDGDGRLAGRIIYLNDVTELVERERRISILHRILRHNIRNELTIVSGHLEILESAVPPKNRSDVETAIESTERIIELSDKARNIEETLHHGDSTVHVDLIGTLRAIVQDIDQQFSTASISIDHQAIDAEEPSHHINVVDSDLFDTALFELIFNSIVHNNSNEPRTVIAIRPRNEHTLIRIKDNGPGIPDGEKQVLDARNETPLEHSSGLGLWIAKWMVKLSRGTIAFEENDEGGTTVTLEMETCSSEEITRQCC